MNLTLKNKDHRKRAILLSVQRTKFTSNLNLVAKQIRERIRIPIHSSIRNSAVSSKLQKDSLQSFSSHLTTRQPSPQKKPPSTPKSQTRNFQQGGAKEELLMMKQKGKSYGLKIRLKGSHVTRSMRVIMGEWLLQVSQELNIPKVCHYYAMNYTDRYTQLVRVSRSEYQGVGLCGLFIASKLQMSSFPSIQSFLEALNHTIQKESFLALEKNMMCQLKYQLNPPTLYQYMHSLLNLLGEYLQKNNLEEQVVDLSEGSELYLDLLWMLDGVHLEQDPKRSINSERVCLALLLIVLKKNQPKFCPDTKIDISKVFEKFMKTIFVDYHIIQLQEYLQLYAKWAKYDRSSVNEEEEGDLLKKVIFND